MGKVVEFKQDIHDNNIDIQKIFNELIHNIEIVKSDKNFIDEASLNELIYLQRYINNMLNKTKERNWKNERREKNFIDYYNSFKEERNGLSNLNMTYFLSLFTYCSDINSSLLDVDINYSKRIVDAIDRNLNTFYINDTKTIDRVIGNVTKPMIKNIVNKNSDPDYALYDMMDGLISGIDVFTVSSWYKYDDSSEESNSVNTIDKIREYYLKQETLSYIEKSIDKDNIELLSVEHELKMLLLNDINRINDFDDEYKDIYLELVKKIKNKKNVDKEIIDIINLTNVYLEYGEQIVEFDIDDIEHYIEIGGKKYENRRF